MYNEPIRLTFVSYPTGPMTTVAHYEFDESLYHWLDTEVSSDNATFVQHYDYYSMWEDHIESQAYEAFLDARHDWQYSEQPSDPEDLFLFEQEEGDTSMDLIPF